MNKTNNAPSNPVQKNQNNPYSEEQEKKTLEEICKVLDENKAQNIVYLDMNPLYGYSSWFLIATALSTVHLKKLATEIVHYLKRQGTYLSILPNQADFDSGWVVIDCSGIIVHVFLSETRELYKLEELWKKAPKTEFNG